MEENKIKVSSSKVYLIIPSDIETDMDVLRKALEIYQIATANKTRLTNAELNLMVYYLRFGYSDQTKDDYRDDTGISPNGLHVLNNKLRDKGYLQKSQIKNNVSFLSNDMESLRKNLMTGAGMNIVIKANDKSKSAI